MSSIICEEVFDEISHPSEEGLYLLAFVFKIYYIQNESRKVIIKTFIYKIICLSEIRDYASKIGIDPDSEPQLLPLAAEGLMKALPTGWKPW